MFGDKLSQKLHTFYNLLLYSAILYTFYRLALNYSNFYVFKLETEQNSFPSNNAILGFLVYTRVFNSFCDSIAN